MLPTSHKRNSAVFKGLLNGSKIIKLNFRSALDANSCVHVRANNLFFSPLGILYCYIIGGIPFFPNK